MSEAVSKVGITGVRRVAVPVSDQGRAYAFYVDMLGFEVRRWCNSATRTTTSCCSVEDSGGR